MKLTGRRSNNVIDLRQATGNVYKESCALYALVKGSANKAMQKNQPNAQINWNPVLTKQELQAVINDPAAPAVAKRAARQFEQINAFNRDNDPKNFSLREFTSFTALLVKVPD
ncbi:MAG: hypothetical protein VKJ06_01795 [Vampirovibrionales bacterium]|nr:hypothetical protein [Vampirovibrionales bacterium]